MVDLAGCKKKRKEGGLTADLFEAFDEIGNRFENESLMSMKMRKLIRAVGEEEVGLLFEACSKHSYVGAHRKCEVSVKNLASFFPNWNMTRACVVWFDHELKEASLRPESL